MIILHNIDTNTMLEIREMTKHFENNVTVAFDKETENFTVMFDGHSIPIILKYYNLDNTLRLELGAKYLDLPYYDYSEVTIV